MIRSLVSVLRASALFFFVVMCANILVSERQVISFLRGTSHLNGSSRRKISLPIRLRY